MGNASADEATATAVDLARVNANIQQVIDSSFQPTDVIEGVSFKLNPKNADLEKLKLQAVATATAKSSPWAPNEKTIVKATIKSKTEAGTTADTTNATVDTRVGLKTQVMKLIQFLAEKGLKQAQNLAKPGQEAEVEALKQNMSQLQAATSLTEVAPLLIEMKRLILAINAGSSDTDFIQKIDIRTTSANGKVVVIEIAYTDKVEIFGLEFTNIGLKLNDANIIGGFTMLGQLPASYVEQLKGSLRKELTAIQNNEPDTIAKLKSAIQDWAETAKAFLGDNS